MKSEMFFQAPFTLIGVVRRVLDSFCSKKINFQGPRGRVKRCLNFLTFFTLYIGWDHPPISSVLDPAYVEI
jgi:hypothetical protein